MIYIKLGTGHDNIPGKIVRKELSVPFANLINTSLSRNICQVLGNVLRSVSF